LWFNGVLPLPFEPQTTTTQSRSETVENAHYFREKLAAGKTLLGTCITFTDPTVTEALSQVLDFVWIDTEHNPLSLERVQGHLLATKGSQTVPLVRVPANDPVLVKPVLDIGAAGVIVPLVKTADDVRLAVAARAAAAERLRHPRRARVLPDGQP
jgi:2-keto-3-deoxy-L-rhamnonate aldolase RhmA